MKPYQQVVIEECHEALVKVPLDRFAIESPHPYQKLLAPYGNKSPYYLRVGVLERLLIAQQVLQDTYVGWQIQIFDAYRPIAVQQFMVNHTFKQVLQAEGLTLETLTESEKQSISEQVYQFWAVPSLDPTTPPPHSTGAAVDVTLVDAAGQVVNMGSAIDEMSPRSYPDHYAIRYAMNHALEDAVSIEAGTHPDQALVGLTPAKFHQNRQTLKFAMSAAGFEQHPHEWWHFSYGDQLWAWLASPKSPNRTPVARYGAI